MVSSFNDAISAYRNAAAGKTNTVAETVTGTGTKVNPGKVLPTWYAVRHMMPTQPWSIANR